MRIHKLSLVFALTLSAFTPITATEVFALDNDVVSQGCTVAQLRMPKAKQCIDMIMKEGGTSHHVECSGGTISCCNDEADSGGRPAGFCIDIKRIVQTKRPKISVAPVETAQ